MTRQTWRERLDARIDRCPGCDDWRWDRACNRCSERRTWQPVDRWLGRRERAA